MGANVDLVSNQILSTHYYLTGALTNCTGVKPIALSISNCGEKTLKKTGKIRKLRKNHRGGIPFPSMDEQEIHVTCTCIRESM